MKCGDMSSGPSAVLVLMSCAASSSCCCVNGSVVGCFGREREETVCSTSVSIVLLKAGSCGTVDTCWICRPMMLRLSIGVRDGGVPGDAKGGRERVEDGTHLCQAVHTIRLS